MKEYTFEEIPSSKKIEKANKFVDVAYGMRQTGNHRIVKEVSVEESIQYMNSEGYKLTYGSKPVWIPFRRAHKGAIPKKLTRPYCIEDGVIIRGSPCPICRDDYLVVHQKNLKLLKQFLDPSTGKLLDASKTSVCQTAQLHLRIALDRARDSGLITHEVPFRHYDYSLYRPSVQSDSPES